MSNPVKFNPPIFKGSQSYPDQIQPMPAVRVVGTYSGAAQLSVTNQANTSYTKRNSFDGIKEHSEGYFNNVRVTQDLVQRTAEASLVGKESLISNFVQSQRHNFRLSDTQYTHTHREFDGIKLSYTAMHGVFEIVQASINISEKMLAAQYFKDLDEKEEKEKDDDYLVAVVFYGGNSIAYAPMSKLDLGINAVQGDQRQLTGSNWGNDILKCCQLVIGDKLSAIYTELTGLSTSTVSRGEYYTITSSKLIEEQEVTDTYIKEGEYPIMNGSGNIAYVGAATVTFDKDGKISSFTPVFQGTDDGGSVTLSWAISPDGTRYSGGDIYSSRSVAFSGGTPIPAYTSASSNGVADYAGNYDKYDNEWFQGNPDADGPPCMYKVNGSLVTFFPTGPGRSLSATGSEYPFITNIGPQSDPWYSIGTYTDGSAGSVPIPVMYTGPRGDATVATLPMTWSMSFVYNFSDELSNRARPIWTVYTSDSSYSSSGSWDNYSGSTSTTYQGLLGSFLWPEDDRTGPPGKAPDSFRFSFIPFPYTPAGSPVFKVTTDQPGGVGEILPYTSTIQTPYGDEFSWTWPALGFEFAGWLNIASEDYLLQAYALYDREAGSWKKYMYFNGGSVLTVIDIPIESVQCVLFDVPLSRIKLFK